MTILSEIREALGIRPGGVLIFEVTGPGAGQFRVLRTTRPLDEFFEACRVDGPVPADLWNTVAEDLVRDAAPAVPGVLIGRSHLRGGGSGTRGHFERSFI